MESPAPANLGTADADRVAYWRLTLRCCSQLCFQSNEWTGLLFLVAVWIASPISAAYLLVGAVLAPVGRMLLKEKDPAVKTGLPGLNPCLIALSLPAFYHVGWTNVSMWMVLLVCVVIAVVLVRVCIVLVPFPILVAPFLIIIWTLYSLTPWLHFLEPLPVKTTYDAALVPVVQVLLCLGQTIFAPNIWSGLLYASGVFVSNWRHGILAVVGAAIGAAGSYYYCEAVPEAAKLGFYGFNSVLAAVSVYIFCGGKLRLAILGALLAPILTPAIAMFGLPTLAAPFVVTTWLMLALGWVEDHWFATPAPTVPAPSTTQPRAGSLPA